MAEFLSDAWRRELADRLAKVAFDGQLTVDVVVRTRENEIKYRVELTRDGTRLPDDQRGVADLTLVLDEDGARALAEGRANAQELLSSGALKLRGDLSTLLQQAEALGALRRPE